MVEGGEAQVALWARDQGAGHALGWTRGSVLGVYAHGLFESADLLRAQFGPGTRSWDQVLDGLADYIDRHFDAGVLSEWTRQT